MSSAIAQPNAEIARPGMARLWRALIWGFCLLLVAGIWWFVILQTAFERGRAVEEAIRQNENRTIAFEQYVRRTLEAGDLVTRYVGSRFSRGNAGPEFVGTPGHPSRISGNVARSGTFLSITIIDPDGNIVATSITRPLPSLNVAMVPAFRGHLGRDDGLLHISAPVFGPLLGRNVIWLTRRLDRPDGTFAGVIAINILPDQFTAFYRDAQVNPMDMVAVVGLDGIVRARRVGDMITSGEDVRSGEVTRMQIEGRELSGTHLGPSQHDNLVRYVSHRRLQNYPLFVAYGVLESEVLAASRYRARIFFAGAALISLFIIAFAALLTLYLSRRDRRLAELALANRRLQEAQRIGEIGDWDYDLSTGATTWSPQLLAMYERGDLGSPTFDEFKSYLDDEGRATIERAHADAIRTGEAQEIDYAVRLPSGSESHHQSAVIPTFDAKGEVVRLHGTDQDVTGRKMLDLLQTQVAHLSRIEAMNAMAATLAHELNQPLTAASNYLVGSRRRLDAEGASVPEEVTQGMAAAEQQVHLAADIIRRVREMVSNPPHVAAAVSVTRVVDDALALISVGTVAPDTRIVKTIAADAKTVTGDRIQIQQVMINLIRNACDATQSKRGAKIVIESRRAEGDMIAISVSDNGVGFSQPPGERFSPFATTKGSGLGLGLSISRTIIESHGGRIWTEDRKGGGASVCFTLPAPRPRAGRKAKAGRED